MNNNEKELIEMQYLQAKCIIGKAIGALEYVAFNYDGTKESSVPKNLIDSTGVSETAIISARELTEFSKSIKRSFFTDQPDTKLIGQWQTNKPEFAEDCICLTVAGKYYSSFIIKKVNNGYGEYMALLDMNGDEYDALSELTAEKYLIIPLPK